VADNVEMKKDEQLEMVRFFVEKNMVDCVEGRRCVDGRYVGEEGTIARAGADAGYVQVLLSLKKQGVIGLSVGECVEAVRAGVESLGGVFTFHTDGHASTNLESGEIGCGHLTKSMDPSLSAGYEIDHEEMKHAVKYMKKLEKHGKARQSVLSGKHAEQGVLVVTGTDRTVKPKSKKEMYFVYDKTRDMKYIERLVQAMNLPGVNFEKFWQVSEQQTTETLHNLALGKPIYEVNSDQEKPIVNKIGVVT
jgi:hypothetical protein